MNNVIIIDLFDYITRFSTTLYEQYAVKLTSTAIYNLFDKLVKNALGSVISAKAIHCNELVDGIGAGLAMEFIDQLLSTLEEDVHTLIVQHVDISEFTVRYSLLNSFKVLIHLLPKPLDNTFYYHQRKQEIETAIRNGDWVPEADRRMYGY